ncbi:hypothetical protein [Ralstonia phage phiRSL1]|uniref:Uncharacterized protein n=1 Tax=Ralstonia phage phiRSL1 TaxID=1980924 RepID=B2ZXR8_9CAUD|nr:hypothetical protein RSL1_ORF053 [Ralstonia phage phiRSL1]BAG41499.1 hypothetical protein [Ralstonia phage phiRSL1]
MATSTFTKIKKKAVKTPAQNVDQSRRLLHLMHRYKMLEQELCTMLDSPIELELELVVNKQDEWCTTHGADMSGDLDPSWKVVGFRLTYPDPTYDKREPGNLPYAKTSTLINASSQDSLFEAVEADLRILQNLGVQAKSERREKERLLKKLKSSFKEDELKTMGIRV